MSRRAAPHSRATGRRQARIASASAGGARRKQPSWTRGAARASWAPAWSPLAALRRHPLIAFFVLAYGFSWLADVVLYALLGLPAVVSTPVYTAGPTVAALTVIAVTGGRPELARLLRGVLRWRVGLKWYVFALFGVPLVYLVGTFVVPGALAGFQPVPPVRWFVTYLVVFSIVFFVDGPLFEEPGWRGFALPCLQSQFGPLRGTLLLGTLWGVWHFPQYFLVPEWAAQNGGLQLSSMAVYAVLVIALATIMTWVYNHTRGSLLLAMLVHSSVNTSQLVVVNELFPSMATTEINALLAFGGMALVLIVVTRGRLGCAARTR